MLGYAPEDIEISSDEHSSDEENRIMILQQ